MCTECFIRKERGRRGNAVTTLGARNENFYRKVQSCTQKCSATFFKIHCFALPLPFLLSSKHSVHTATKNLNIKFDLDPLIPVLPYKILMGQLIVF